MRVARSFRQATVEDEEEPHGLVEPAALLGALREGVVVEELLAELDRVRERDPEQEQDEDEADRDDEDDDGRERAVDGAARP